ncbi:MAG: Gfo/Idh/MocA family oxidoreductase [Planctomycetota bacterium]
MEQNQHDTARPLSWGIVGTGNIAGQFCDGAKDTPRARFAAVGSRSIDKSQAFAEAHHVEHAFGSYEEVLHDDTVDAVYISLPNALHAEWTIKALDAGKHVLCEKPLAMNADEAQAMFAAAERNGRVLIEAFMYRCHPQFAATCKLIADGAIGELRTIDASFCYRMRDPAGNIRFAPELGGGAMMDIGCYCVDVIRVIVAHHTTEGIEPEPFHMSAVARQHPAGIDENASFVAQFGDGVLATARVGMGVQMDNALRIGGTEGHLTIDVPWKPPQTDATIRVRRQTPPKMEGGGNAPPEQTHQVSADHPLFGLEAEAFAAAVLDNAEPFITPRETLANHRLMDRLKAMIRAGA